MNFIKSPAFWLLLVIITAAPHVSEGVAILIAIGSLSLAFITALLVGLKR